MAKRILIISLILISLSQLYQMVQSDEIETDLSPTADQTEVDQAFQATVTITMYGFEPRAESTGGIASNAPETGSTQGLGTLVTYNGRELIVTHDHWHLLDGEVELVQFRNAHGQLLAQMDGASFLNLVQYRDGGTMLLSKPRQLADAITAAPWTDMKSLAPGSVVQVIHRNRDGQGGVAAVEATVEGILMENGVPALSLRSQNGHVIVPGDSGGGVWLNGQLIGNLWMTITKEIRETAAPQAIDARIEQNWSMAALLTNSVRDELPAVTEHVPSQSAGPETDAAQMARDISPQGPAPESPLAGIG